MRTRPRCSSLSLFPPRRTPLDRGVLAAGSPRMVATVNDAARETVQALLDAWWDDESQLAAERDASLEALDESLKALDGWGDRFAREQVTREATTRLRDAERAAADEHRRRLEHDLAVARSRVFDLERGLQERTEELLRVQAANNALSAELQSMIDAWPLSEGLPPGADAWGSAAERQLAGLPLDGAAPTPETGTGIGIAGFAPLETLGAADLIDQITAAPPSPVGQSAGSPSWEPQAEQPPVAGTATSKFARLRTKRGPSSDAA
ncbi:MAG: hypothetical protein ACRCT8_08935 [Lacipirellulaceae bacterium]